jgi:hypothetical protein
VTAGTQSRYGRLKRGSDKLQARVERAVRMGWVKGYTPVYLQQYPDVLDSVIIEKLEG